MSWQIVAIIAGVFLIGLALGRGLGGGRSGGERLVAVAARPRLAESARHEAGSHGVRLTAGGPNKIAVIKALRSFTLLGLKESKDMVDNAPTVVASGVSRAAAEDLVQHLRDAGGAAELT